MSIIRYFIPEHIKGYYLIPTRIIGFDITKDTVRAAQVYCKGREIQIEKFYEAPIQMGPNSTWQDAASDALSIIAAQLPRYTSIVSTLPSSQVIFKELRLPFRGIETIKKVISYEVEPLLPFAQSEAVIDCIITKDLPEEQSSEVLVAAVQNQYIAAHLALLAAAGLEPEKITIDLLALYGLYLLIPAYSTAHEATVLLEIESQSTRLAYMYNNQLRFVRTLTKGLHEYAHMAAPALGVSDQETLEQITRFGLHDDANPEYSKVMQTTFAAFFKDIGFTLQSFTSLSKSTSTINKIILFGKSASLPGLAQLIEQYTQIPTTHLQLNSLIHNGLGIAAQTAIPQSHMVSLAAALPKGITRNFNLRQKEFSPATGKLLARQLLVALSFIGIILGSLVTASVWHIQRLKKEAISNEQEAIDTLRSYVKKIPDDATTLDEAVTAAKTEINREEKVWSAFSGNARSNFLHYLLELSTIINKASLGLEMERLSINEETGTIILKAQVKGYDELRTLEHDLEQSKLFSYVERVSDPKFTMTLRLAKSGVKR